MGGAGGKDGGKGGERAKGGEGEITVASLSVHDVCRVFRFLVAGWIIRWDRNLGAWMGLGKREGLGGEGDRLVRYPRIKTS